MSRNSSYHLRFAGHVPCSRARQTVEKVVIDLMKSMATTGLTFVCPSQVNWLLNLLDWPIPFHRLSKLGGKHTWNQIYEEENGIFRCLHYLFDNEEWRKGVLSCFVVYLRIHSYTHHDREGSINQNHGILMLTIPKHLRWRYLFNVYPLEKDYDLQYLART